MVDVVLCICTCKRPEGLERLLRAVAELNEFGGRLSVVVVDNDPIKTEGLEVCERLASTFRWPLSCTVEERLGISFARNHAVTTALEQKPDFIAMIDDDEWPCQNWLRELLKVQAETDAHIVGGPVFPELPDGAPSWVIEGRFFEITEARDHHLLPRHPQNGASARISSTANFLVKAECVISLMPTPFKPRFALTGGGDAFFFGELGKSQFRNMRWSTDALVFETVPSSRMNLKWLMKRWFRYGCNTIVIQKALTQRSNSTLLFRTLKNFAASGLYAITHCYSTVGCVRGLLKLSRAAGRVSALCGFEFHEYRSVHTTDATIG